MSNWNKAAVVIAVRASGPLDWLVGGANHAMRLWTMRLPEVLLLNLPNPEKCSITINSY
jgi:spore maturation protein SpmB